MVKNYAIWGDFLRIYIYLDESGNIHKNSKANYFAIGGYMVYDDKFTVSKVKNKYKKINKKHKQQRNMDLNKELKSRDMTVAEKIELIQGIQTIDNFFGCAIVFDKTHMIKEIDHANMFFNYGVKILFEDCIFKLGK